MQPLIQHFVVGNSRLVYRQFDKPDLLLNSWKRELKAMDDLLLASSQIQLAVPEVYFYFFLPGDKEEFSETQVWLGREIIGFADENSFDDYKVYDLFQGEGLEMALPEGIEFSLDRILQFEGIFRELAAENHFPVASTWRVVLKDNHILALQMFKDIG